MIKITDSEGKFRMWARQQYPFAYIRKLPDMKTIGSGLAQGLPDYMIIDCNNTKWFEVKWIKQKTLNLKTHFTPAQHIEFRKIIDTGTLINVFVWNKDLTQHKIISYEKIRKEKKIKLF